MDGRAWHVFEVGDTWPDFTKIEQIPRGRWATLVECPGSVLWIRERGQASHELRLFVGQPMPLDPDRDYEIRCAHSPLEMLSPPLPANGSHQYRSRKIRVIVTMLDLPVRGGVVRGQLLQQGNVGNYSTTIARFCTLGLTDVHMRVRNLATGAGSGDTIAVSMIPKDVESPIGAASAADGLEGSPFISVNCLQNAGLDLGMALDHTPIHSGSTNQRENLGDDCEVFIASTFGVGAIFRLSWIGRPGAER